MLPFATSFIVFGIQGTGNGLGDRFVWRLLFLGLPGVLTLTVLVHERLWRGRPDDVMSAVTFLGVGSAGLVSYVILFLFCYFFGGMRGGLLP
jgi:hypothetical protein